jgi:hypothetical protein
VRGGEKIGFDYQGCWALTVFIAIANQANDFALDR